MGEAINKIKNNMNEFWQGLEKNQKITITIIATISIILILGVAVISAMPRYQILYPNLDAKDAGQIRDKLKDMKVPVKVEGTTILVPKDKIDEARITLAMEGLPANDFVFPDMLKSSFNETSEDKKQKYLLYMQKSLANGIKSLNGVEWAQVNLFIPDDNVFVLESNKLDSSASIIVKMKPGLLPLDPVQVNGIVQYVSKSVKGLRPENVSIIDDEGRSLKVEGGSIDAQVNRQLDIQEATRLSIQNSVKKFLESVFGINNVNVLATVKLNFSSEVENQKVFEPVNKEANTGVVRNMEEIKKNWVDAGTGGIPGTDTNIEISNYPQVESSKSNYDETSKVVNYEISETQRQIVKEQGNIEKFSISVIINKDRLKDDALNNIEGLKDDVENLVKYATQGLNVQASDMENNIYVQVMDFDTSLKDEIKTLQEEEAKQKKRQTLIMLLTALLSLLALSIPAIMLLRRKKHFEEQSEMEAAISKITEVAEVSDIELDDKNEVKKKIEKFVIQKPEQVAQLLKTWLNEE